MYIIVGNGIKKSIFSSFNKIYSMSQEVCPNPTILLVSIFRENISDKNCWFISELMDVLLDHIRYNTKCVLNASVFWLKGMWPYCAVWKKLGGQIFLMKKSIFTFRPKKLCLLQIGIDDDDAMIIEIWDYYASCRSETDTTRWVKMLPHGSCPFESIFVYKNTIGCEQLNAMITCIRDDNLAMRVAGHIPRVVKLAIATALLTEC